MEGSHGGTRGVGTVPTRAARLVRTTLFSVLVLAGGCGGDDAITASTPEVASAAALGPVGSAAAPVAPPVTPASTPAVQPTSPPVPDATTTLTAALDTLATGYHFVTTVTVDGRTTLVAEGDHVAGTTQMTVTSDGSSTRYLVTRDAAWTRADGGWQRLDSTGGLADPVSQLRSPRSVELVGTAEAATITAHYDTAVLVVRGTGERSVEFQLADGLITSLRYASTAAVAGAGGTTRAQHTEVHAVITPIESGTEITLPPAAG